MERKQNGLIQLTAFLDAYGHDRFSEMLNTSMDSTGIAEFIFLHGNKSAPGMMQELQENDLIWFIGAAHQDGILASLPISVSTIGIDNLKGLLTLTKNAAIVADFLKLSIRDLEIITPIIPDLLKLESEEFSEFIKVMKIMTEQKEKYGGIVILKDFISKIGGDNFKKLFDPSITSRIASPSTFTDDTLATFIFNANQIEQISDIMSLSKLIEKKLTRFISLVNTDGYEKFNILIEKIGAQKLILVLITQYMTIDIIKEFISSLNIFSENMLKMKEEEFLAFINVFLTSVERKLGLKRLIEMITPLIGQLNWFAKLVKKGKESIREKFNSIKNKRLEEEEEEDEHSSIVSHDTEKDSEEIRMKLIIAFAESIGETARKLFTSNFEFSLNNIATLVSLQLPFDIPDPSHYVKMAQAA